MLTGPTHFHHPVHRFVSVKDKRVLLKSVFFENVVISFNSTDWDHFLAWDNFYVPGIFMKIFDCTSFDVSF